MYEQFQALDDIRLNFNSQGLLLINITLAFIMFGVALEIKVEHFRQVINRPKSVLVGFGSQFILLPAVTFLVVKSLGNVISPAVAMGMILVASCPGGNISNFMSSLAKANTALSVSLTAIATLGAIVLTPLNFAIWGGLYTSSSDLLQPITIDPIEMFKTVFILLGIPLVLGMYFAHKFPKITAKIVKPLKNISMLIFIGIVIMAFTNNYEYFIKYIGLIFLLVLAHNAVALATGYLAGTIFWLPKPDRRTTTIETGIQNSGLGLVLLFNPRIFEEPVGGMAFIAAWWGIWHIISGLGLASILARIPYKDSRKPLEAVVEQVVED
ncbi:MAG: bile acid:sodium symporter family protein [Bacteroidales bacterium]